MPFYGEWERTLDARWRVALPTKIQKGIGHKVFLAATDENGGLRILPGTFKPPKGEERMFHEVDLRKRSGSLLILIGGDVRRQFRFSIKPHSKVLLVGCGDHLELYPAGSR